MRFDWRVVDLRHLELRRESDLLNEAAAMFNVSNVAESVSMYWLVMGAWCVLSCICVSWVGSETVSRHSTFTQQHIEDQSGSMLEIL